MLKQSYHWLKSNISVRQAKSYGVRVQFIKKAPNHRTRSLSSNKFGLVNWNSSMVSANNIHWSYCLKLLEITRHMPANIRTQLCTVCRTSYATKVEKVACFTTACFHDINRIWCLGVYSYSILLKYVRESDIFWWMYEVNILIARDLEIVVCARQNSNECEHWTECSTVYLTMYECVVCTVYTGSLSLAPLNAFQNNSVCCTEIQWTTFSFVCSI